MTSGAGSNGSQTETLPGERGRDGSRLAGAAAAMARVEREIDSLWRDSIAVDDPDVSERLAELSHALHRAARSLERRDRAIG